MQSLFTGRCDGCDKPSVVRHGVYEWCEECAVKVLHECHECKELMHKSNGDYCVRCQENDPDYKI